VTGSPVTNSGTLGLNWNVAPTSANTSNAIVKRDASGNFSAGNISTVTLTASNPAGLAIAGTTGAPSGAIAGVNTGTSAGSDGVDGVTSSASAAGVAGINNGGGYGVYGAGGVGVFGSGSTYGFQTDSNVNQARTAGGWVKAMVFASGLSGDIVSCFNSTLSGASATTPPCGFTMGKPGTGDYIIDFGFQVDDRFLGATSADTFITVGVCTDFIGLTCINSLTPNQVEVTSSAAARAQYWDNKFYLIVY